MTYTYADQATKTLKKAVPTVDADGKVIKWDIEIEYSLNEYISTFNKSVDIEPTKEPSDFTRSELFELADISHLDAVYDSQYQSVKLAPESTTQIISDFNLDSLA